MAQTKKTTKEIKPGLASRADETTATAAEVRKPRAKAAKKSASRGAVASKGRAKPGKRYTAARIRRLLDSMLGQVEEQIQDNGLRFSPGDALRIMQLREGDPAEKPREVQVEWVEPKT